MLTNNNKKDKIIGLLFGFVALNSSIIAYILIQKYNFKLFNLLILFFLSFVLFYGATLSKNYFIKKFFWVGVTLTVFGSWIAADFYKLKLYAERFGEDSKYAISVNADGHIPMNDSIFKFKNYKVQEKFKSVDTFIIQNKKINYVVYPLVDIDWGTTDSIKYWVCYKYEKLILGKSHKDYNHEILSQNAVGFEIKNEVDRRKFNDAIWKGIYENNLKLKDNFKIVEMIDYYFEAKFWNRRIIFTIVTANIIWILLAFFNAKNPD